MKKEVMEETDIYVKIELLKEKINGYYQANEKCINVAEKKKNWDSVKYFQGLNFSLDIVKGFMEDLGL